MADETVVFKVQLDANGVESGLRGIGQALLDITLQKEAAVTTESKLAAETTATTSAIEKQAAAVSQSNSGFTKRTALELSAIAADLEWYNAQGKLEAAGQSLIKTLQDESVVVGMGLKQADAFTTATYESAIAVRMQLQAVAAAEGALLKEAQAAEAAAAATAVLNKSQNEASLRAAEWSSKLSGASFRQETDASRALLATLDELVVDLEQGVKREDEFTLATYRAAEALIAEFEAAKKVASVTKIGAAIAATMPISSVVTPTTTTTAPNLMAGWSPAVQVAEAAAAVGAAAQAQNTLTTAINTTTTALPPLTTNLTASTTATQNMARAAQLAAIANLPMIAQLQALTNPTATEKTILAGLTAQCQAAGVAIPPVVTALNATGAAASAATPPIAAASVSTAGVGAAASGATPPVYALGGALGAIAATAAAAAGSSGGGGLAGAGKAAAGATPPIAAMGAAATGAATGLANAGGAGGGVIPPLNAIGAAAAGAAQGLYSAGAAAAMTVSQYLQANVALGVLKFGFEQLQVVFNFVIGQLKDLVGLALKELVTDAVQLAARVETLGVAVVRVGANAGYTRDQVLAFDQGIQAMNITTQQSRQGMLYMAEAQIDFAKGQQIARIAQDAAIIGNINSSEAFQRMVNAIQRAEPRMLRALGISLSFERAYDRQAAAMGKTQEQLSEYEKAQIRLNEVIRVGERLHGTYEAAMDTAGKRMQSLPRLTEQIKLAFGNVFLEGFSQGVFALYETLDKLRAALEDTANAPALKDLQTAFGFISEDLITMIQGLTKSLGDLLGLSSKDFKETIESVARFITKLSMFPEVFAEWKTARDKAMSEDATARDKAREDQLQANRDYSSGQFADWFAGGPQGWGRSLLGPPTPPKPPPMDIFGEALGISAVGDKVKSLNDTWNEKMSAMEWKSFDELVGMRTGKSQLQLNLDEQITLTKDALSQLNLAKETAAKDAQENQNEVDLIEAQRSVALGKLGRRYLEDLTQANIDAARKREDIWSQYYEDLAKIDQAYQLKRVDAATDLSDDLAKIDRDFATKGQDGQVEYDRKIDAINDQYNLDRIDAQRQLNLDLIDLELELSRTRADIWTEYARTVQDIQTKNAQAVTDINTGHVRDMADLDQKKLDDDAQAAIDHSNKMIDGEIDYQRKLQQIRRDFATEAGELIRQRDAIGYLRAQRQMQSDLEAAVVSHSQSQADESRANSIAAAERKRQYEIAKRELEKENQQKLDDQATQLQRELDAAGKNRDENLADALQAYDEDRADRLDKYDQDLGDLQTAHDRELQASRAARERDRADQQAAYERAIAEARIAYELKLRDLQSAQQRELAAAAASREQSLLAARRNYDQQLADLRKNTRDKAIESNLAFNAQIKAEQERWAIKKKQDDANIADSLVKWRAYVQDMVRMYQTLMAERERSAQNYPAPRGGFGGYGLGASGLVTSALTQPRYNPPAMPSRLSGPSWGGKRDVSVNVNVTGAVDAVTSSQLVRTVREVVQGALAG